MHMLPAQHRSYDELETERPIEEIGMAAAIERHRRDIERVAPRLYWTVIA